jgi:DNA processing protein
MAAGIDTVAHTAALAAGGRTIAVMGTGIDKVYPKESALLAARIPGKQGALVSQFWPGSPPSKYNFPLRNVVTSGISLGTVVVEASHTSGARLQARLAVEHGKRVFLVRSLVMQEEWARKFAERKGVKVVETVDEVLPTMEAELEVPQTLAF